MDIEEDLFLKKMDILRRICKIEMCNSLEINLQDVEDFVLFDGFWDLIFNEWTVKTSQSGSIMLHTFTLLPIFNGV